MKKSLVISAIVLALIGAYFYARTFYVPYQVEQRILSEFNQYGFTNLETVKIDRMPGEITIHDLALDEDGFSNIQRLRVSYSPMSFFLSSHYAHNIIIEGLSLTGELNEDMSVAISGWNNNERILNNLYSTPAKSIDLKDATIDLMTEAYGGISLKSDIQMKLSGSDKIDIEGIVKSKQRKLGFHSKINGNLTKDGHLTLNIEAEQLAITHDHFNIRRGAAKIKFAHLLGHASSISAQATLPSLQWYGMPLKNTQLTIERSDGNYNLNAEGGVFGHEDIEWSTHINNVNGVSNTETSITPTDLSELLAFLTRNKNLNENTEIPAFLIKLKKPVLTVNTSIQDEEVLQGSFKFLSEAPNFELEGDFEHNEEKQRIIGSFQLPTTYITPTEPTDTQTGFQVSTDGNFSIQNISLKTNSNPKIIWQMDTEVKDGMLDYGGLKIGNIGEQFSFNIDQEKPLNNTLSFKLPLKNAIKQKGSIRLNLDNEDSPLFEGATYKIYGGQIQTQEPIFENSKFRTQNSFSVSDINLARLFKDAGFKDITITGKLGGIIPFTVKNDKMLINDAILQSQSGGTIKLPKKIVNQLFPGDSKQMVTIRAALDNYYYEFFEIRLDGDVSGRVMMTLNASGYNPDFKNSDPVSLTLQIETKISPLFKNLMN